jgi:hypothetical protein
MGDRSFIQVSSRDFQTPITLYGHYAGTSNLDAVRDVLRDTDRIGDPSYLVAQLFHRFSVVEGRYDGALGFGIDAFGTNPDLVADNPTVFVNADTGEYTYQEITHDEFTRTKV